MMATEAKVVGTQFYIGAAINVCFDEGDRIEVYENDELTGLRFEGGRLGQGAGCSVAVIPSTARGGNAAALVAELRRVADAIEARLQGACEQCGELLSDRSKRACITGAGHPRQSWEG